MGIDPGSRLASTHTGDRAAGKQEIPHALRWEEPALCSRSRRPPCCYNDGNPFTKRRRFRILFQRHQAAHARRCRQVLAFLVSRCARFALLSKVTCHSMGIMLSPCARGSPSPDAAFCHAASLRFRASCLARRPRRLPLLRRQSAHAAHYLRCPVFEGAPTCQLTRRGRTCTSSGLPASDYTGSRG